MRRLMTRGKSRRRHALIKVAVAALVLSQHCPAIAATVPTLTNFAAYSLPDGRVQVSWVSDVPVPTGILEAHDGSSFRKVAGAPERHVRNHRVTVEGWRPGAHVRIRVRAEARAGSEFVSAPVELELPQVPRRSAREQTIPLNLASRPLAERVIVAAVPLPPGQLWQPAEAWAEAGGTPLPSQASISSRWPDGSVRWLSAGLLVPADAANLRFRIGEPAESATNPFEIRQSPEELIIGNGLLCLRFAKGSFALFEEVSHADGLNWAGTPRAGNIQMTDGEGVVFGLGLPDHLELEERGPVQAVVLAEGPFQNQSGANWFRYRIRWFLAAHSPLVRVQVTFINDVMQPEFQRLTSATILLPLAGDGVLRGQLAGARTQDIMQPGRNAVQQVTDHCLRRVEEGRASQRDERSPGWVVAERGAARLALVFRDFWQTWPKGLALNPEGIQLNVLPALAETEYSAGDLHDWLKHY